MTGSRDLHAAYRQGLAAHGYTADAAQLAAVGKLEALRRALRSTRTDTGPMFNWFGLRMARATPAIRGVYLWGGVGRGKTFLMDLFHAQVGVPSRRDHFHRFMKEVHARLRELREVEDPLALVADGIAAQCKVQCLDELYVGDIADAMILSALFESLIERGVTLVFTSNAPPADLYRDGLQRQRFLPAIALIERSTEVVNVDAGQDYRLRQLERAPLYLDSAQPQADAELLQRFSAIAGEPGVADTTLTIEGREIPVRRLGDEVVWFDFAAICDGPRGTADYVEIARDHHAVFVSGVPQFDATRDNEARRFIALVDEFYDRNVKLVVSAAAAPEALYAGERLGFEFARTASRLVEMQSHEYLAREHRA